MVDSPKSYRSQSSKNYMTNQSRQKRREPFEVLLRRFNREIQISGLLTEIKRRRFFSKDQSRTIKRLSAIRKSTRKKQLRGY